jgi:HlyD family secretion protein
VEAAKSRVDAAQIRTEFTTRELARIQTLAQSGTVSAQALDQARLNDETAQLELTRARSDLLSLQATLGANRLTIERLRETIQRKRIERQEIVASIDRSEAALERSRHDLELAKIVSPIDGVVLERFERGERPLALGTELLHLGNPAEIEVVADILSEDALKLQPGSEVRYESGPSGLELHGKVKRIEPQGFTKLSSLGVEQQRVNVIASVENPPAHLGVEFRLHARFFTGSKQDALIVPRFAVLQAPDQTFYVFVVRDGEIARQPVSLGLRSDLEIEVVEGLDEESVVVAAPDTTLEPGASVRPIPRS